MVKNRLALSIPEFLHNFTVLMVISVSFEVKKKKPISLRNFRCYRDISNTIFLENTNSPIHMNPSTNIGNNVGKNLKDL